MQPMDVPAMKEEPYLSSLDNYTTKIKFELANINLKELGVLKRFTTSWNDIAKSLNEDNNFGVQLKNSDFYG